LCLCYFVCVYMVDGGLLFSESGVSELNSPDWLLFSCEMTFYAKKVLKFT